MAVGLAANFIGETIINSYYAGKIESTGTTVGGLAGNTMSGAAGSMVPPITATSIYWDSEVSGVSTCNIGESKTTSDLKTQSTFDGWDFDDIWSMPEDGYPVLAWEETKNTAAIETSVYEECKVYPATEGITVVSESEITGITVYTLTGALANSTKPYASSVTIGLPKGYYIVKVITTTGEFVSKTVVY